ncbi:hypothetical protein TTHERM_00502200 (macronuclear) [Tetrahymena thermophila SB210]|uniref:Uncharacterized protein n=1 Tax=Tetrahymena thermophila (strain SB210) TaxID=312017 RepID=I7MLG0_TETTS|nr:hypothetical protein TTHERM_00502200 [Tetrahymena thermophila SB210]EAS02029.2 hypothetical protein TTHERM_00502200 [Tetrahymena thermophila SB210]|eukprot:XP_001022274.2 hypothetical protein TTHERM_00502200 [Tetrahymena thermophila SB210]
MSSFQERFKGKTSTISKEGVIPSLDKPPVSKGYIQKDLSIQQQDRYQGINDYPQKANNQNNSSRGIQSTSSNPSTNTPISNSNQASGSKNNQQYVKAYGSEGVVLNKQQQSNSNFSTRSEQSNKSKISISQKLQYQQQQNDPYKQTNPFNLDIIQLMAGGGNLQQNQNQNSRDNIGSNNHQQYFSDNNIGQLNKSNQRQNSNNLQNYHASSHLNIQNNGLNDIINISNDDTSTNSKLKGQARGSKSSAYTLEKNTKIQPNQANLPNQNSYHNPYTNYNPYTLDAIENINQNPGKNQKNSSSPDIQRQNRILKQQQNNLYNQEQEANVYIQSYVPSFAQHQSTDNSRQQQQQQNIINNNLNNSKKSQSIEYPVVLQQRGGLGANIGTDDWKQKKDLQDKKLEYSNQVKYFNQQQLTNLPPSNQRKPKQKEEEKKISSRDKALEFSKNIPKPKAKTDKQFTEESSNTKQSNNFYNNPNRYSNDSSPSNQTNTIQSQNSNGYSTKQYESDLESLERQHLEYLNKIEQLNMN